MLSNVCFVGHRSIDRSTALLLEGGSGFGAVIIIMATEDGNDTVTRTSAADNEAMVATERRPAQCSGHRSEIICRK